MAPTASATPIVASVSDATETYVLLYPNGAKTSHAAAAVKRRRRNARRQLRGDRRRHRPLGERQLRNGHRAVARACRPAATTGLGVYGGVDLNAADAPPPRPAPGSDSEPLAGLQWDMAQINAFAAHEISGGDPDVVVGDIDTGLDFTHPDLAPNYSAALSADCSSGAPTPLLPGNDVNGHGTHTAGTIAAAVNGIGIYRRGPECHDCRHQVEQR